MANFLVVDKDETQRSIMIIRINNLGHNVIAEAKNGLEAYQKYKLFKPDYVTLDILMMDGIESIKLIKKFDKNSQIIAVSSLGEEKLVMKSLVYGAKTFLVKPISEDNLKASIEYSINKLV